MMDYHELLSYNADTGELSWKKRPVSMFKNEHDANCWNSRFSGQVTGYKCKRKDGAPDHVVTTIMWKRLAAHRVIWEMFNGPIPKGALIDHIDGDPFNNRLGNLRLATRAQNAYNSVPGVLKGVYRGKRHKNWQPMINADGRRYFLGGFPTKGLAALAYAKASLRLHGKHSIFYRRYAAKSLQHGCHVGAYLKAK